MACGSGALNYEPVANALAKVHEQKNHLSCREQSQNGRKYVIFLPKP